MSTIVDVYLHGSVHLTNPGLEELLADTLSQGMSRSLLGPRGPADFPKGPLLGRPKLSADMTSDVSAEKASVVS